ncbi:ferredoxin reductase family protein [Actinopolymorpha pittospori]|uniref:Ferric reductase n=1 Tax=Actinopolymorpha pittospori TaxID=648752 RepID=A0A927R8V0_9ACTN|nr:ferric reductase-like transmembrane domain-containing protein [Actinopolymorpha pittospori]MBE1603330.1 putative ferric reductase [Actinopolymorpha pittospori]
MRSSPTSAGQRHRATLVSGAGTELRAYWAHHAPTVLWVLIITGGLAPTWLWWHSTHPPTSLGGELSEAGRVTGLYAGYLVMALLVLMARVPFLERSVGADRLARLHGVLGKYVVGVAVMHGVLIWWGYAVTQHADPLRQAGRLLTEYAYVLWATIGAALLVVVGVVSARAVRRRVRYETWYFLHLLTYAAIASAFLHQIETGAQFVTNATARVVWTILYCLAAATLAWFRLVVPLRNAWRHRFIVADVRDEAPDVVSIYLVGTRLRELEAEAGQFLRLRFLTRGSWWQSHPYSLSAAPNPHWLRITVKALGDHTRQLQKVPPGTKVMVEGPYGALTARRRSRHSVLLIAGGVGITPLRALFETLPAEAGNLTLLYRTRSSVDLVFRQEIDTIAVARKATVRYIVGPAGDHDPLHPVSIRRLIPDVSTRDVYVCGPAGMTATAIRSLRACGVPRWRIHHEDFSL